MPFTKNADGVLVDEQGYDRSGNKPALSNEGKAKTDISNAVAPKDPMREGHTPLPMPKDKSLTHVYDDHNPPVGDPNHNYANEY